mgnify:FL=1
MDHYEMIKAHLGKAVPYATHTGAELLEISDGEAKARLTQRPETENHIKGQHAGAMFTLGEAASGAAVAGILAPVISQMRPLRRWPKLHTASLPKARLSRRPPHHAAGPSFWRR